MKRSVGIIMLLMLLSATACREQALADSATLPTTAPFQTEAILPPETTASNEITTEGATEATIEAGPEKPELEQAPVGNSAGKEETQETTKPADTKPQETQPQETEPEETEPEETEPEVVAPENMTDKG